MPGGTDDKEVSPMRLCIVGAGTAYGAGL